MNTRLLGVHKRISGAVPLKLEVERSS